MEYNQGELVVVHSTVAGLDFAKLSLILLNVVSEGEHELLSIFGAHDYAAYYGSLGHAGSCEDEVDEEFVRTVTDHSEVAVFAVSEFGTELNLKLVLLFVLICHFIWFLMILLRAHPRMSLGCVSPLSDSRVRLRD